MRYSGHETFSIRDGWLYKGIRLLKQDPRKLVDDYAADWLGVGRNMAKSIRHWVLATGLAEIGSRGTGTKQKRQLRLSELGKLIFKHDRYFGEPGTWWLLHVNLIHSQHSTAAWRWFFNNYGETRFDRHHCLDSMVRYVQVNARKSPSRTTLQKDLSCLLSSYARKIPEERVDVEEALDCPFLELGLFDYYRSSGTYQLNQNGKDIPARVLGYCLALSFGQGQVGAKNPVVTINDAAGHEGGPGRCFVSTGESLLGTALRAEEELGGKRIRVIGLAGDRAIRFTNLPPIEWAKQYYEAR